jgi:hypothetical protein|tara:strand:- start:686 stop:1342 length:657 start_codon:yes stop_codon:yes gene_type:complete
MDKTEFKQNGNLAIKKLSEKRDAAAKKVLFLGYDEGRTKLIEKLIVDGHEVWHTDTPLGDIEGYDIVLGFGYTHMLKGDVLKNDSCPIVNLHTSYLPFNRGTHPNFWSFYDGTPSGVTIHLINEGVEKGIDTGDVLFQRHVKFDAEEKTFRQTYKRLMDEIEALFIENMAVIMSKNFSVTPQMGAGSCHKEVDLPKEFEGWDSVIADEIARLHGLLNG